MPSTVRPKSGPAHRARIRLPVLFLWLFALALLSREAVADEPPWRQTRFDLQATNEPLNVFLSRLFTADGVPAVISEPVATGRVNGRFRGRAEAIYKELAETYGLAAYYDGATVYVYSLSEIETRLLQLEPADVARVEKTLRQMRLYEPRYPLRLSPSEGQILVSGPPRYVDLVAEVAGRVAESPTRPRAAMEVRVFRLKYASAGDSSVTIAGVTTLVPGVARTLNDLVGGSTTNAPTTAPRQLPSAQPGLRGQGLASQGLDFALNPKAPAAPSAATGSSGAIVTSPSAPSDNGSGSLIGNLAANRLAGRGGAPAEAPKATPAGPSVRADPRLNAVIVRDTRDRMPMYAELIEALDVAIPLVQIEATVIDISDDKSDQLGIDWRIHGPHVDLLSGPSGLGAGSPSTTTTVGGTVTATPQSLTFAGNPLSQGTGLIGTLLFGDERSYFLSRLNLLAQKGDASLVSRPQVLTLDHSEAVLQSTSDFYVRVAGNQQTDLFNVSVGMVLRVTPTLVDDAEGRRFALQIRIDDGSTGNGASVDGIPVVSRSGIATQAVVGDGQSILIGGYTTEQKVNSNTGVPVLSDLPFVGWIFGQRGTQLHRVQRMYLITPKLVTLDGARLPVPGSPGVPPATSLSFDLDPGASSPLPVPAASGVR